MTSNTSTELIGYLDGLRGGIWISGWALAPAGSTEPATVIVCREGVAIARVVADQHRADVAQALGTARTHYGFLVNLRNLAQAVELRAGDALRFIVEGRPDGANALSDKALVLPSHCAMLRHAGSFDGVAPDGHLIGWASDAAASNERITVHFFIDDMPVGSTQTGLERRDVENSGRGGLESGFRAAVATDRRLVHLRPGARLVVTFDESGLLPLDGGELLLDSQTVDSLLLGATDEIAKGDCPITLADLLELLSTTRLQTLLRQSEKAVLFARVARRQIALDIAPDIPAVLDSANGRAVFASPDVCVELLRLYGQVRRGAIVDGDLDRVNSSFLDHHHADLDKAQAGKVNAVVHDLLVLLYRELSASCHAAPQTAITAQVRTLTLQLARWSHRILNDNRLALNFLEFMPREGAAEASTERDVVLAAKLYRGTGRNAKALSLLSSAISSDTESWWMLHEHAVLLGVLIRAEPGLAFALLPVAIGHFSRALALNPQQDLSRREAWKLLRDVENALITQARDAIAVSGIAASVDQRQRQVELLIAQCMATVDDAPGLADTRTAVGARLVSRRKIAYWGSRSLFQCFYYRVKQKIDSMDSLACETEYLDLAEQGSEDWRRRLLGTAVIYACRVPATVNALEIFAYAKSLRIPIIYDIDDLIFDYSAFPPPFETYGGTISRELHHHLALDNPFFQGAMRLADRCTVSTPPLLEEVRKHVRPDVEVAVLPNLLSREVLFLAERIRPRYSNAGPPRARLVIFYGSATKAHKQVFYDVFLPAALAILDSHSFVDLHLVGFFANLPERHLASGRIKLLEPTADYLGYLQLLREADINASVLEPSRATDAKSEIKWLEAAAFGIPSIVSPTAAYRALLTNGRDALFAQTQAEWQEQLRLLVEQPELRSTLGRAARELAFERFHPDVADAILAKTLADLLPPAEPRSRKRVLIVNVFFAPQSVGGATRVAETQVRGLVSQFQDEFEVFVLTSHADPDPARQYGVEQYWSDGVLVTRIHVPSKEWFDHNDAKVAAIVEELCECYRFDLIHMHSVQVLTASIALVARSLRIPYVVTLHDAWWLSRYMFLVDELGEPVDPNNPLSGGRPQDIAVRERSLIERSMLLREVLGDAAAVLAVSEKFRLLYREAGIADVEVHENASEPIAVVRRDRSGSGKLVLGFIGGMSRHKGYHLLRQAIEEGSFPDYSAIIVDHALDPGESYHSKWGATPIEFISKTKQKDIGELYGRLDVLVAPSIWPESYGLVTREALQAGVWVIASDRGAIGDCIVEGVNGNIVDVNDHLALQAALAALPERFAASAERPQPSQAVGTVSVGDHLERLAAFYRAAMEKRP